MLALEVTETWFHGMRNSLNFDFPENRRHLWTKFSN